MTGGTQLEQEILVVDDSAAGVGSLSPILGSAGYRVRTASCADAAWGQLQGTGADLVLLDEEGVRELNERLEQAVRQRTAELEAENERLRREVAERERGEKEMKSNWLLLQSVIDNSTAVIYVKNAQGRYLLVNRSFEVLFGVTREWLVGRTDYDIFPKERADAFRASDEKVLSTGRALQSEEWAPQKDGVHIYLSTKAPLADESGKVNAICGVSTDITEIKRAEEEHVAHLRFLESLEQVDRAIRQAESLESMMTDVLDTALSLFASDRAWLLYPCDPDSESWRVPMERTREEYPGALVMGVDIPTSPEISEAFRVSLVGGDPIVYDPRSGRSLPPEVTREFSVQSQIMMAVYPKRGKPWLFGMHQCSHAREWEEKDVHLFKEMGRRIADGLSSLIFLGELQESSEELERRVIDRTSRLEEANLELTGLARQLESAYEELKSAHMRVLQQEKMASIGQLAAGVAHEINNPIGFIISNLNSLERYTRKMTDFIAVQREKVEQCAAQGDPRCQEAMEELSRIKRGMKVDYVIDDLANLIQESLEGAERVRQIVQNLKTFSRVEAADLRTSSDLNAGLESTINIIWNELKYKAVVVKDYGVIPTVDCNLGQLNQVFLNILMNAGQAIEKQGTISVKSWSDEKMVYVSISDTGSGIAQEKLPRIFEPFFTTKPVGEGTGLGLSIAYDIIKKHDGEITVASEVGKGTRFTVAIPVG